MNRQRTLRLLFAFVTLIALALLNGCSGSSEKSDAEIKAEDQKKSAADPTLSSGGPSLGNPGGTGRTQTSK